MSTPALFAISLCAYVSARAFDRQLPAAMKSLDMKVCRGQLTELDAAADELLAPALGSRLILAVPLGAVLPCAHEASQDLRLISYRVSDDATVEGHTHKLLVGISCPSLRGHSMVALLIPASAPSRTCSWCLMLRMRAGLPLLTSMAVFTCLFSSKSKQPMPKPQRSPSICSAKRRASIRLDVLSGEANPLDRVLCAHDLAEDGAVTLSERDEDALVNLVLTGEHDVAKEDAHLRDVDLIDHDVKCEIRRLDCVDVVSENALPIEGMPTRVLSIAGFAMAKAVVMQPVSTTRATPPDSMMAPCLSKRTVTIL